MDAVVIYHHPRPTSLGQVEDLRVHLAENDQGDPDWPIPHNGIFRFATAGGEWLFVPADRLISIKTST